MHHFLLVSSLATLFLIGPTDIFVDLAAAAHAELDANAMAMVSAPPVMQSIYS